MRKVRADMGLTNVKLMVPFCRTVKRAARFWRSWRSTGSSGAKTAWKST